MVYFIQQTGSKAIKVGRAQSVEKRLAGLQTSSPDQLIVLAVIESEDDDRIYHRQFSEDCIRGEWFWPSDAILNFIGNLPKTKYAGLCRLMNRNYASEEQLLAKQKSADKLRQKTWTAPKHRAIEQPKSRPNPRPKPGREPSPVQSNSDRLMEQKWNGFFANKKNVVETPLQTLMSYFRVSEGESVHAN